MQIIIAAAVIVALSFIIQLTKMSPTKKIYILDLFLVIVGSLAIYSELTHKLNDFTESLTASFSKQYTLEYQLDDLLTKNQIQEHSFQLYYGVQKNGISTFLQLLINKALKDNKQGIYINIQTEIQTQEQALQLFGTNNLHELVHFIQQKPSLIAVDNIHLSLSKKICYLCQILTSLHKVNTTTIIISAKELNNLNYLIDDYSVNVMEIKEFISMKGIGFRYDWNQEAISQNKKYEDLIIQKQKEFVSNLNESEKSLMNIIRKAMCKIKCENQNIKLDDFQYQYGDLKNLVDRNYIIAQFGLIRFYNNFIFESLQYL